MSIASAGWEMLSGIDVGKSSFSESRRRFNASVAPDFTAKWIQCVSTEKAGIKPRDNDYDKMPVSFPGEGANTV